MASVFSVPGLPKGPSRLHGDRPCTHRAPPKAEQRDEPRAPQDLPHPGCPQCAREPPGASARRARSPSRRWAKRGPSRGARAGGRGTHATPVSSSEKESPCAGPRGFPAPSPSRALVRPRFPAWPRGRRAPGAGRGGARGWGAGRGRLGRGESPGT